MPTVEDRVDAIEQAMAEQLGMLEDLRLAVGGVAEGVSRHSLQIDRLIVDMREVRKVLAEHGAALKGFSEVQAQHTATLAQILELLQQSKGQQ